MMILSLIVAIIGLSFSVIAKKTFEKGLYETDSYRMVTEFNKSKKYRSYSTILLLLSMLLFSLSLIELFFKNLDII
jgi:hypothetical protein